MDRRGAAQAAPEKLLVATQRAGLDEARHARHAFTLASRFAGATIGPAGLPLGASIEIAPDLPALAARVVAEGCVEETMSLLAAERMLRGTSDPAVRFVLTALASDERRHVELAWKTVKWAITAGGPSRRPSPSRSPKRARPYLTTRKRSDRVSRPGALSRTGPFVRRLGMDSRR